jgi:hypothetical protein
MKFIKIGKRMVAADQVAFVELFDPAANPEFKPEKDFKARVILLDRDILLTEQTPLAFAEEHGLHFFVEDGVAVNKAIQFKIEMFEPTESFKPARPYKTRIKWSDLTGGEQSKLLLTEPESVITQILEAKVEAPATEARPAKRPARGRRGSRRMEAFRA